MIKKNRVKGIRWKVKSGAQTYQISLISMVKKCLFGYAGLLNSNVMKFQVTGTIVKSCSPLEPALRFSSAITISDNHMIFKFCKIDGSEIDFHNFLHFLFTFIPKYIVQSRRKCHDE